MLRRGRRQLHLVNLLFNSGTVTSVGVTVPSILSVSGSPVTSSGTIAITTTVAPTGTGAIVLATSPTLVTPVLGIASGTSLNLTSLTASYSVHTDASKNLVSIQNSGTGLNVLQTSPTLVTPVLGVASATSLGVSGDVTVNSALISNRTGSTIRITGDSSGNTYIQSGTAFTAGSTCTLNFSPILSATSVMSLTGSGFLTVTGGILVENVNPIITIRTSGAGGGAVHFGNSNHGVFRDGNDVVMFTTSAGLYYRIAGNSGSNILGLSSSSSRFQTRSFQVAGVAGVSGTSSATFYVSNGAIGDGNGAINVGTLSFAGAQLLTFYNDSSSAVGNISLVGGSGGVTTSFNTTSDYRLKKNVRPIKKPISRIMKLKPSTYEFISNNAEMDGFIAHELQEIVPWAVTGEKDGSQMQSVDYSKLTPLLVAAVQELYSLLKPNPS